jgi:hypothetical protein
VNNHVRSAHGIVVDCEVRSGRQLLMPGIEGSGIVQNSTLIIQKAGYLFGGAQIWNQHDEAAQDKGRLPVAIDDVRIHRGFGLIAEGFGLLFAKLEKHESPLGHATATIGTGNVVPKNREIEAQSRECFLSLL